MNRRLVLALVISMFLCAGCGSESAPVAATPDFFTATLPPTPTIQAVQTIPPPIPTSTVEAEEVLVEGMTTTQVNVRAEPSTASASLGMVGIFVKVQIAGRDASGIWYQILYAESEAGKGWVRAEYVQVNSGVGIRPVAVSPASGGGAAVSGVALQKVNVRSGPGVDYELLGALNSNDLVVITGRDAAGGWLQIEFADSADGRGWVAAEFLRAADVESVPSIGAVAEETPVPSIAPEAALQVAAQDGDSMQAPLAVTVFSAMGSRALQVQGDVSAPDGDAEDWIQFKSNGGVVSIEATCPRSAMRVELWNAGTSVKSFPCGERAITDAAADNEFFIRLIQGEAGYTGYILNLEVLP